ncbi:MAG: nucleotide exchange factor GrpE [Bacteroidaceae bacterium]|nr:nucleotide exchange factor GrpE [Bacteroidaceae bacterium]
MSKDINNSEEELLEEEVAQEEKETAEEEAKIEEAEEAPQEKTVEEKLADAEAQIAELKNQMLYKAAEFDNYRKRVMQEKAELIKNGGAKVITSILPIIDDFERAEQNMEKLEDVAACKEGVALIIDKFMKLLKQEGLEKMDVVGKPFDTDFHEAVAMVPGMPEDQKNKVIDCIMEGYLLNDKVIRHAKVAVAE